jgi:hypothetical protein
MIKSSRNWVALCSVLASLCACADQQAASADQVVALGEQKLTLENDQQRCVLRKPDQSMLPLEMPWPCQFAVDRQGKPHVESFNNVPIVIVLHVSVDPANSRECRSEYRAVRQFKGQLEPSVVARSASCLRGAGDQKDYTGLFIW